MHKNKDTELLKYMISFLTYNLEELSSIADTSDDEFIYGEKTAYVECLELLSTWDKAKENGLNFDIEQRFPL